MVVDNGSVDGTGPGLVAFPWVEVVRNPVNRGFAAGCNQGADLATGDALVFLNNDTLVTGGWLDELLAPLADGQVGAVGPRSNNVSGEQLVQTVPYQPDDPESVRRFALDWQRTHRGQTSECHRLPGFCLAVPTTTFRQLGGFDEQFAVGGFEDDDFCMQLRKMGHRLMIAHGSFVHHRAHATFDANQVDWRERQKENQRRFRTKWGMEGMPPLSLLSVCLIVKDEEKLLAACLRSVGDVADEVVVYDTGSTDRTVEIARAGGARVIEGEWADSFAQARNAALAHANGDWVLSLDADETLLADPVTLRRLLADRRSEVEAYLVAIENLHGAGQARSVHTAVRLFRRVACTWRHRLHEQVVAKEGGRRLCIGYLSGARIIHRGYVAEVFDAKEKASRNLSLARAALDDDESERPYALMNYGRALESAGRSEEAIESLRHAIEISNDPIIGRLATQNLIYILGRLGRFEDALAQVGQLRQISVSQIAADIAEGRLRISMGDATTGLALLARVPQRGRDDDGMEYAAHMLSSIRGEALASLGRFDEAADVVLAAVRHDGVFEADLGELTLWLTMARRRPSEIADALDVTDLVPMLGRVMRQEPEVADTVLEGIWTKFPDRLEPLAAASRVATRLSVARALVWSTRLRQRGLSGACPLVAMVNDEDLDPRTRVLAGAAAFGSFGERGVVNGVHNARHKLDPLALIESTDEIGRIAPGLLEATHLDPVPMAPVAPPAASDPDPSRRRATTTGALVVASEPRRGGVNIVGPFESTAAEGDVARILAHALRHHGVPVSTASYHADGQMGPVPWTHGERGDHPFDTTLLVLRPEDVASFVIDHGAGPFDGRYMIAFWLWDLAVPSEVMPTTSRMVHEIWVPSQFAVDAVAKSTDRLVTRMLLPIGRPGGLGRPGRGHGGAGPFTFESSVDLARGLQRQNPFGVIDAFRRAFGPGEGPRLRIDVLSADRYPAEHDAMVAATADRADIELRVGVDSPTSDLTAERSCVVSLSRSEGTGLVLARAMVAGIPTIATTYSFAAEVPGPHACFAVPFSLVPIPVSECRGADGARWAEPDLEAAARAMRVVFEQPRSATAVARRAQERALRQFAPSRSARAMRDRLAAIDRLRHGDPVAAGRHGVPVAAGRHGLVPST